jgi:pantoate--beta-alanine ligase
MFILKQAEDLKHFIFKERNAGKIIGLVPTMGALHQGHISLIKKSIEQSDMTICSIFVNPTQFNNKADFDKYPITLESDKKMLEDAGTTILFTPSVQDMYPIGLQDVKKYDIGYLDTVLDGKMRPGHFQGVCAIVHKLLEATKPHHLFMGEKDFQQCLVVQQLIKQEMLPTILHTCPTLREENGLAMSSRNMRLSIDGKQKAATIYKCLTSIKEKQLTHTFNELKQACIALLTAEGFETEYILLANAANLELITDFDKDKKMVVLIASKLEEVRLIDNLRIN